MGYARSVCRAGVRVRVREDSGGGRIWEEGGAVVRS
jgi:hypothetical protein